MNYLFPSNDIEAQRLLRLNELYNPNIINCIEPYVHTNMRVLELGPGIGLMGVWFAKKIGNSENYTALDISKEQLQRLDAVFEQSGIEKPNTIVGDLTQIQALIEANRQYDIIYARWVLEYLPVNLRIEMLSILYRDYLNDNGLLIIEAGNLLPCQTINSVTNQAFDDWYNLTLKLQEPCKFDFTYGKHMLDELAKTELTLKYQPSKFQPILSSIKEKEILALAIPGSREFIINLGLTNKEESLLLEKGLKALATSSDISIKFVENTIAICSKEKEI